MKEHNCKLRSFLENTYLSYAGGVIGGVLLCCVLALVPHSAFAVDFPSYTTSDYKVKMFYSTTTNLYGCNTVRSASGILAVGARGSLFGADNNTTGCGYYEGNNGLDFHSSVSSYKSTFNYNYDGSLYEVTGETGLGSSLTNNSYLEKNFRTSIYAIGSQSMNIDDWATIDSAVDSKFGKYIYIQVWQVPSDQYKVASHLTPSVYLNSNDISLTGDDLDTFYKDVYEHTIFEFGDPKDYLPTDLYNYVSLNLGITPSNTWDSGDYAYLISYIPQYSSSYLLKKITYMVDTPQVQSTIDTSLGGFSQWEVGAGNNSQSSTYPKLSYFYLSRPYTENNTLSNNIIKNLRFYNFRCISATCYDQALVALKNVEDKHQKDTSGWDFSENTGGQWFDVFNFGLSFPFTSLFTSFTNDRCVNIPIISSWLNTNQTQYCTWWDSGIRSTLTPIFNTFSLFILFGFIYSWLSGRSANLFKDNDTSRLGDRF